MNKMREIFPIQTFDEPKLKELYGGIIIINREDACVVRIKNNNHCIAVTNKNRLINIARVTRQYLTEAYPNDDFKDYPDIRCPSLDKVVEERFWIHYVSDPASTINAAYLLELDPIPTIKKWLEGLPIEVVVTDLNNSLGTTKRASYRTAIYEVIRDHDGVITKLHTKYTGGTAFDDSLTLREVGLNFDSEVDEVIPKEEETQQ